MTERLQSVFKKGRSRLADEIGLDARAELQPRDETTGTRFQASVFGFVIPGEYEAVFQGLLFCCWFCLLLVLFEVCFVFCSVVGFVCRFVY